MAHLGGGSIGGYRLRFVDEDELDLDLKCPICLLVMCKPNLTNCCGGHFCESCIEHVRQSSQFSSSCPKCRRSRFNIMIDQNLNRRINQLRVYCTNTSKGCHWTGMLRTLAPHINKGKVDGDCLYHQLKCPLFCGAAVLRKNIPIHMNELCPERPATCSYCPFSSTYREVQASHLPNCEHYPLDCPNGCSEGTIARCRMSSHLDACPLQLVECSYANLGCDTTVVRSTLETHIKDSVHVHLELIRASNKSLKDDLTTLSSEVANSTESIKKDLTEFKVSILGTVEALQTEVKQIQRQLQQCQSDNSNLTTQIQQLHLQQNEHGQNGRTQNGLPSPINQGDNSVPIHTLFGNRALAHSTPVDPLLRLFNSANIPSSSPSPPTEPVVLQGTVHLIAAQLSQVEADAIVVPVNPYKPHFSGAPAQSVDDASQGALFTQLSTLCSRVWEGNVSHLLTPSEWSLHCRHVLLLPRSKSTKLDTLKQSCRRALNEAKSLNLTSIALPPVSPHKPPNQVAKMMMECFLEFRQQNHYDLTITVVVKEGDKSFAAFRGLQLWTT